MKQSKNKPIKEIGLEKIEDEIDLTSEERYRFIFKKIIGRELDGEEIGRVT